MSGVAKAVILFISQGAYSGRFPVAPGTAGTVVGVLLYLGIMGLAPLWYLVVCGVLVVAGTWTAGRAEKILGCTDCQSIVIDEIAGYLVTMFMAPASWGFILGGFILFRAFDIAKPWPLKRLQDLHGGPGVMLDDIGAGIYANIALQATAFILSR